MGVLGTPEARGGRLAAWATSLFVAILLLMVFCLLPFFSPAEGATLKEQLALKQKALNAAYAELDALQDELDDLAKQCNVAEVKLAGIESDINDAQKEIALSDQDMSIAQAQLGQRVVSLYKQGYKTSAEQYLQALFDSSDLVSVLNRFDTISKLADQDQKLFDQVAAYNEQSKADEAVLQQKQEEQAAELAELGKLQEEMNQKFTDSASRYKRLENQVIALKEEIRKADAAAAAAAAAARAAAKAAATKTASSNSGGGGGSGGGTVQSGPFVFPVAGPHSFVDSFGAPRSGGRTHQGIDIMAARGTPAVACVTGTITSVNTADTGLGGRTIHLAGSNGRSYYYAHLDSIASGIHAGVSVSAGQVIGYVGNTGNARYGACHLHFEIRVNGSAINPYATLRAYDN